MTKACRICGDARPERKRALRDQYHRRTFGISAHEFHGSGEVRGILCLSPNQGLGNFADDPGRLERAAPYLRAAREGSGAG